MNSKPAAASPLCAVHRRQTRLGRFWVLFPALAVAVALAACVANSSSLPGTSLGKYDVVATLGTNTCGSGINASNPWDVTVELSKDGTTLYLANTDGSDEVSGTLDSNGTTATLISAVTANVDGSDAGGPGPCNLTLSTSFALTLSSDSPPKTFAGTAAFTYSVATAVSSTTNCTDQLASSGGKYSTLPCTVNYTLKATRQ
jgi:hypothetical protein